MILLVFLFFILLAIVALTPIGLLGAGIIYLVMRAMGYWR